jgi:hypothetical protein
VKRDIVVIAFVVFWVITFSGCDISGSSTTTTKIQFDFAAEEAERVDFYRYVEVPVDAQMKTIVGVDRIKATMDKLSSIELIAQKDRDESYAGMSYYAFRFYLKNNEKYEIVCLDYGLKDIDIVSYDQFSYSAEFEFEDLWQEFDDPITSVPEDQLPVLITTR